MNWSVHRSMNPGVMWQRYADAIGLEILQQTFGEHWPPKEARPLEEIWVWRDRDLSPKPFDTKDHPAAWLSLSYDQHNPSVAHMSRGVWPDQHGKNLGKLMRVFAEDWCRQHGVDDLRIEVDDSNDQHLKNVMADRNWRHFQITWDDEGGVVHGFAHDVNP